MSQARTCTTIGPDKRGNVTVVMETIPPGPGMKVHWLKVDQAEWRDNPAVTITRLHDALDAA